MKKVIYSFLIAILLNSYGFINLGYAQDSKDTVEISFYRIEQRPNELPTPYFKTITFLKESLEARLGSNSAISDSLSVKYLFNYKETTGSFHTAISIDDSRSNKKSFGIGLVQSDVLYHYLHGNHPQVPISKKNADLRAIARIFPEWLHISVPATHLDTILILSKNKDQILSLFDEIVVNDIGSGSLVTTLNVGRIMNLNWKTFSTSPVNEYYFDFTVKTPSSLDEDLKLIQIGLDESSARLISTAFDSAYDFVNSAQFYSKYKNELTEEYDRGTVAVNAVLVGNKNAPNDVILEIKNILSQLWELDESYVSDKNGKFLINETSFRDTAIYPTFESHFKSMPINRHYSLEMEDIDPFSSAILEILSSRAIFYWTIIAVLYLYFRTYVPDFWKKIRSNNLATETKFRFFFKSIRKFLFILSIIFIYHFAISIFIYVSEHHYAKENVAIDIIAQGGILDTFKWLFRHLTVGNPTETLHSNIALVWVGLLQFTYALASSIAAFMAGEHIVRFIKQKRMKNHIVIIGWSPIGKRVVEELEKMSELYQKRILEVSIIGSLAYESTNVKEKLKGSYHMKHNMLEDFDKLHLEKSRAIIILSDKDWALEQNNSDVDLWTINRIHEINGYLKEKLQKESNSNINEGPRIIAEIKNEKSIQLTKDIGADEVICIQNFGLELLAQAATRPNISTIFDQLLRSNDETNEIYYRKIPQLENVKNFKIYSKLIRFLISNDQLLKQTPIGIFRIDIDGNTEIEINPDDNFIVKDDDKIIVLAKEQMW